MKNSCTGFKNFKVTFFAMKYDFVLVALYLLILAVIAIELFNMVAITVVFVLMILVVILQKVGLQDLIDSLRLGTDKRIEEISQKVDLIAMKADEIKSDVNRQLSFVDNKMADMRHLMDIEIGNSYNELSRKLAIIEDRLNDVKQIFSAAVGSMDERLKNVEDAENRF